MLYQRNFVLLEPNIVWFRIALTWLRSAVLQVICHIEKTQTTSHGSNIEFLWFLFLCLGFFFPLSVYRSLEFAQDTHQNKTPWRFQMALPWTELRCTTPALARWPISCSRLPTSSCLWRWMIQRRVSLVPSASSVEVPHRTSSDALEKDKTR